MSAAQVSNPVPKDTKTINDIISSHDTSSYLANKELVARRRSSKESELNQDLNRSDYQSYKQSVLSSDYESGKERRRKKIKSVSKGRPPLSKKKLTSYGMKLKSTTNDFDPDSINDGLDEIDILIDQLEQGVPEDIYETEELDIDGMMRANRLLRDKIGQISQMVINAITKAGNLKKQIITHRDKPADREVAIREREMRSYEAKINK